MKIRIRCKCLDILRVPKFNLIVKNFDFLSLGYSNIFNNHFAYLNVWGFQVSIEWGYIEPNRRIK